MKFALPKDGKINPEPPGLMVVKDPDAKRYTTVAKLALLHAEQVEVYGWANRDTVEDMMIYLPCLLPKVLIPTGKLKQHVVWEWRSSRYQPTRQVQVLKYSNTPENLAVIKDTFNN